MQKASFLNQVSNERGLDGRFLTRWIRSEGNFVRCEWQRRLRPQPLAHRRLPGMGAAALVGMFEDAVAVQVGRLVHGGGGGE